MHSCPDCGQACYCEGDIDDLDFGDDCPGADACQHYLECEKEEAMDCCDVTEVAP